MESRFDRVSDNRNDRDWLVDLVGVLVFGYLIAVIYVLMNGRVSSW